MTWFGESQPTVDEQRESLSMLLMSQMEQLQPLFDVADGMRADLRARGWSTDIVEYLAGAWLAALLSKVGAA